MSNKIAIASKIKLISGQHIEAVYCNTVGNGIPYLTGPSDFSGKTPIASKYTEYPKVCCQKGDILITVKGSGTGSIAIADQTYCISRQLMAIRCKDVNPYFIQHLLEQNEKIFNSAASGLIPGISRLDVLKLKIPNLKLSEQTNIASLLSTWSTAIEKIEKLIEAKRLLHVARTSKLLSRKSSAIPLKAFLKPTLRAVSKPDKSYWALGIRSHGKGTFRRFVENPNSVAMDTLYRVKHDDLIINITFAWEGAIALVDKTNEDCFVSHRFPTFEINRIRALPEYLRHVIVQKRFIRNLGLISPGGAGRNRVLNKTDFLNLKISLPKVSEQEKIGNILNTSLKEISLLGNKLEMLKKQKRGLMQKLLTGEWRVKTAEEIK